MASSPEVHDLIVVGGGPAGLAAAIAGQSERVDTLVIDDFQRGEQLGGQAATTSCIKNLPGFPKGISGDDLMTKFAQQARDFGAQIEAPLRADRIEQHGDRIAVIASNGETYLGQAALIATGVEFKRLRLTNMAVYVGRGVFYGPPQHHTEHNNKTAIVIGGGNSAGQAAVHLAESDNCSVHVLIRGDSIESRMSGYLVDELAAHENIVVHTNTELVDVDGDDELRLEKATIEVKGQDDTEPTRTTLDVDEIYAMIGMEPQTLWVPDHIAKDEQGFIKGSSDFEPVERDMFLEVTSGRQPFSLETSMPQVFIAGDGRCGTNKRVAMAQADGTAVIAEFHRLREMLPSKKS